MVEWPHVEGEMAELDGISAEQCWSDEVDRGLRAQVGESLPIFRDAPACGRGDGMMSWNIRLP